MSCDLSILNHREVVTNLQIAHQEELSGKLIKSRKSTLAKKNKLGTIPSSNLMEIYNMFNIEVFIYLPF